MWWKAEFKAVLYGPVVRPQSCAEGDLCWHALVMMAGLLLELLCAVCCGSVMADSVLGAATVVQAFHPSWAATLMGSSRVMMTIINVVCGQVGNI